MTVPAVNRTLDLIEVFSQQRRPMTITTLAKILALPASSCHGIVKTLEARGYLTELKEQGGYYFTKRLQLHAERIGGFEPIPKWILPALSSLRDAANETVLLAKLSGDRAIYLEMLESAQSVRYIAQVGDTRPLHASAAGKALLGALPASQRERMMQELDLAKHNNQTIGSIETLRNDIDASLARGWFMTQGEYLADVVAIAAPITSGENLYAVVIAGPTDRMNARLGQLSKHVLNFVEHTPRNE